MKLAIDLFYKFLVERSFFMKNKIKEETIISVADKYKKIFCTLIKEGKESNLGQLLRDESQPFSNSLNVLDYAKENLTANHRFVIHIHFCLSLLKPQEREIIWRDFFLVQPKVNKTDWWVFNYARSTYYRIRNRAINNFYELCK